MPKPRPYIFCRYVMLVDEEKLDQAGQFAALQDIQGQFFAHGPTAEQRGQRDTVIARPHAINIDGEDALVWSVGQKIEQRTVVQYDPIKDSLEYATIDDGTVRYNDFVALPRLGVVAVDDRQNDRHLGAKSAISRLRSAFRYVDGGALNIEMTTTPQDMDRALNDWELREVTFKVRPYNPHPKDELSRQMSEAMMAEGIGTLRSVATPKQGEQMRPNDGPIAQAQSLTEDGYGQMGVKGVMPDGHVAVIPRPQFEQERSRNQRIQAKPREMRVYIETDDDLDEESFTNAASALRRFYDR